MDGRTGFRFVIKIELFVMWIEQKKYFVEKKIEIEENVTVKKIKRKKFISNELCETVLQCLNWKYEQETKANKFMTRCIKLLG